MKRLLVVDDDPLVRATIRQMAEDEGFAVVAVTSGAGARDACRRTAFDVALVDVIMPDEDGLRTMALLRQQHPGLALIGMSGGGRTGNFSLLQLSERAGADAVLRKPFDQDALVEAIRSALSERGRSAPEATP